LSIDPEVPPPSFRPDPEPDWLNEAAVACSFPGMPGMAPAPEAEQVRDILDAAGIPVYMCGYQEDPLTITPPLSEIRIMIPSRYLLEAESVLDREIYNLQQEEVWKDHFATLSDKEFRELDFEVLISGLTDRVARLRNAYKNELAARAEEG
jgi:hypothetical protein